MLGSKNARDNISEPSPTDTETEEDTWEDPFNNYASSPEENLVLKKPKLTSPRYTLHDLYCDESLVVAPPPLHKHSYQSPEQLIQIDSEDEGGNGEKSKRKKLPYSRRPRAGLHPPASSNRPSKNDPPLCRPSILKGLSGARN